MSAPAQVADAEQAITELLGAYQRRLRAMTDVELAHAAAQVEALPGADVHRHLVDEELEWRRTWARVVATHTTGGTR